MDEQYYRKAKARTTFFRWVTNQLKKKNILIVFLIAVPVLSFMTFSNKGLLKRLSLESEKKGMQEKIDAAEAEQRVLKGQSKALESDPKAIEKVAREKYGMLKDGETVYKIKKEK